VSPGAVQKVGDASLFTSRHIQGSSNNHFVDEAKPPGWHWMDSTRGWGEWADIRDGSGSECREPAL